MEVSKCATFCLDSKRVLFVLDQSSIRHKILIILKTITNTCKKQKLIRKMREESVDAIKSTSFL